MSDRWVGQDESWPIVEEDECKVLLGDTKVITGYVDKRSISYGSEEHSFGVSGRDKTGLLVDCSASLDKWEYRNVDLLTFAKRVCDPFGIEVKLNVRLGQESLKPLTKISVDPGDTAFEAIERACRMAGLLAFSDGNGSLILARPGTSRTTTALIEGKNILTAAADFDSSNRYRTYLVLGQHRGSDALNGANAAHIKSYAEDLTVKRAARTLLIRPESNVTVEQAKKRAQWEAIVRAARGDSVSVTVHGWAQENGTLWPVNALVTLQSPFLGINGQMLISEATYSFDEGGTVTHLTLRRPDAFVPEPKITNAKNAAWKEIEGGA